MPLTGSLSLLHLDRAALLRVDRSMTREWLETDGHGGYASSTVLHCPARRQHGLLVAPVPDPGTSSAAGLGKRHVFLSRFEEVLHGGGKSVPISMARYPGVWAPHGHQTVESFDLSPWPSSVHLFGRARIERDVLMAKSARAVLVRYRVSGQRNRVELALRPLLPFREADALTFENIHLDPTTERIAGGIRCRPYPALPSIHIVVGGATHRFSADPIWYRKIEYPADLARGYDGHEDQFSPGEIRIGIENGVDVVVAISLDAPVEEPLELWDRETRARLAAVEALPADPVRSRAAARLVADDFLFRAPDGRLAVLAGFPWFGEWGRDAFISLPGLLLARGRTQECREALEGVLPYLRRGLLPNVFGASAEGSDYGSVDASLWFARAVRLLELASGPASDVGRRFLPALTEIATCYAEGTGLEITMDGGGLLRAGSPTRNVTWMDARTSAGPVTPRDGCAVEIEALWYFLLAYLEDLHVRLGDPERAADWKAKKERAGATFLERFWLPECYLADAWKEEHVARAIRPNMAIAASLEWSPLTREQRELVAFAVETQLLVPYGLRTLEPRDPRYQGRYEGGPEDRDGAYHQGTAWPWLLGFHAEAYLRARGGGERRLEHVRTILRAFDDQMEQGGLLHVSEVFDGDPPHRPGGTIAQAWNTAEILRAWSLVEDPSQLGLAGSAP
jgi:predicted glycogen debranching enzyme